MVFWKRFRALALLGIFGGVAPAISEAGVMTVRVTVENLSPTNTVSFAPLRVGFHNGTFDSFNIGDPATAAIVSVAEGGSGNAWFPAFSAAEPNAVLGSVLPNPAGPLLPGGSGYQDFTFDPAVAGRFFTFATMVVPSNDLFLGNDNPMGFELFDPAGNLLINQIVQKAGQIWDANSEVADAANAAFVAGGNNDLRTAENGVVAFDFSELSTFDGLTTGAGYVFDSSLLNANTDIYRISFSQVPEPSSFALLGLGGIVLAGSRLRRRKALLTCSESQI